MKDHIFRAFSEKSFLYLWLGEIFTQIASNLFNFYLIFAVYALTHSNTAVSGVVISYTVPAILFGIVAGVYVDRWNKKNVLYTTNIIRALLVFVLAFTQSNLTVVYLISFSVAVTTQFFIPAESPLIPLVVSEKYLFSANALFGMGILGSILLAYIATGPVFLALGKTNTLLFITALLLIGAVFIWLIKLKKQDTDKEVEVDITNRSFMQEIRHVFSLVARTKAIFHSVMMLALAQVFILLIAAIAPGYAANVLNMNIAEFPIIFIAPAAVGTIVGAIFIGNFLQHMNKNRMVTIGITLTGVAMLILPFCSKIAAKGIVQLLNPFLPKVLMITNIHIVILLAFIVGIANSLVFVPSNTILQEQTSDEVRGKVYGVMNTLVGLFSFLPVLLVGSLSDWLGITPVLIGIGLSLLIVSISRIKLL
jgi:MFS family permease